MQKDYIGEFKYLDISGAKPDLEKVVGVVIGKQYSKGRLQFTFEVYEDGELLPIVYYVTPDEAKELEGLIEVYFLKIDHWARLPRT